MEGARARSPGIGDTQRAQNNSTEDNASEYSDANERQFQMDLKRAMEASKFESQHHDAISSSTSLKAQNPQGGASTSSGSMSFLSDRAQLEKERLGRLKRYRGEDDKNENTEGCSPQPPVKRPHLSSVESTDRRVTQLQSSSSGPSSSSSSSTHGKFNYKVSGVQVLPVINQLFWDGELRPTANKHSQPRDDGKVTFRLSEVLGPVRNQCHTLFSTQ